MKLFDSRDVAIALGAILFFLLFIPIFTYVYFAQSLKSKDRIMNLKDTGVVLFDDQNKPFFSFYSGKVKSFVPLSDIPKLTQQAVIASEDKGFYNHSGFSVGAIIRSIFEDFKERELVYGGSTITQQLVKNSLLSTNKNFLRKYQEIILAQELERRYSKDEILEMYLNSVYFGRGAFGIEEAAQTYFNKDAKDLDLSESALLSGLLPAPSKLNPQDNLELSNLHRKITLEEMYKQHYITALQLQSASLENPKLSPPDEEINFHAPHFAIMVRNELIQKYGEETIARSGLKVHTSLNSNWQQYAEEVVRQQVKILKENNVSNGAVVVIDPKSGEIKALVGSVDWNNDQFGKFNVVTSARPPGSSFKPIVYSDALERHLITLSTILHDQPTTFNQCKNTPNPNAPGCVYKPVDFDRKFRGSVSVRRALSNSLNVPSVEVMSKVGVVDALEMAHRLGITTLNEDPSNYGLSLVLGAGEVRLLDLTAVYATLARGGKKVTPTDIVSIDDKFGNNVYSSEVTQPQVLDPGVAYLISSILSDSNSRAEEFGNALNISRTAAVKTGTTEDFKDALTLGYTPSLVIGVWVGNNNNTPMDQIAGSLGAAPIWKSLMEKFLANTPVERFDRPDDVISSTVCFTTSKPNEASSSGVYNEYFLEGTKPPNCVIPKAVSSPGVNPTFDIITNAKEDKLKKKD